MSDLLVRGLPKQSADSLRARASRNRRSVQGEAATILSEEAQRSDWLDAADEIYESLRGRHHPNSALLIREDRDTDHGRDSYQYSMAEFADVIDRLDHHFAGRRFDDSAEITRADRDRGHGHL